MPKSRIGDCVIELAPSSRLRRGGLTDGAIQSGTSGGGKAQLDRGTRVSTGEVGAYRGGALIVCRGSCGAGQESRSMASNFAQERHGTVPLKQRSKRCTFAILRSGCTGQDSPRPTNRLPMKARSSACETALRWTRDAAYESTSECTKTANCAEPHLQYRYHSNHRNTISGAPPIVSIGAAV